MSASLGRTKLETHDIAFYSTVGGETREAWQGHSGCLPYEHSEWDRQSTVIRHCNRREKEWRLGPDAGDGEKEQTSS